jgi:hypothetical protein
MCSRILGVSLLQLDSLGMLLASVQTGSSRRLPLCFAQRSKSKPPCTARIISSISLGSISSSSPTGCGGCLHLQIINFSVKQLVSRVLSTKIADSAPHSSRLFASCARLSRNLTLLFGVRYVLVVLWRAIAASRVCMAGSGIWHSGQWRALRASDEDRLFVPLVHNLELRPTQCDVFEQSDMECFDRPRGVRDNENREPGTFHSANPRTKEC